MGASMATKTSLEKNRLRETSLIIAASRCPPVVPRPFAPMIARNPRSEITRRPPKGNRQMTDPKTMTDAELEAACDAGSAACRTAWAAWEAVRDAGQTDLRCPEWQAHGAAQKALDVFGAEIQRRDRARSMAVLEPLLREPLTGPEWDEAWERGPGRDAL
jgi:hypothetical protein